MEVRKCDKDHFYSSEYSTCPFCSGGLAGAAVSPEWDPTEDAKNPTPAPIFGIDGIDENGRPVTLEEYEKRRRAALEEYDDTQPDLPGKDTMGFDPVVGWLVCIGGPNRGKAYRLHSGTNFLGRSREMDICIENDQQISARHAASVTYDDRSFTFFLGRGSGRNNIYLNGAVLRRDADLARYDRIAIGGSEFLFVPLCGERFDWKNEAAQ